MVRLSCRGNHVLTLPEVADRASYAQQQAGGSQAGVMLWSLQLSTGCPNPSQILQAACTTYGMAGCDVNLHFAKQRICSNSSQPPSSPQPGCSGGLAGSSCGAWAGLGICCPAGMCMRATDRAAAVRMHVLWRLAGCARICILPSALLHTHADRVHTVHTSSTCACGVLTVRMLSCCCSVQIFASLLHAAAAAVTADALQASAAACTGEPPSDCSVWTAHATSDNCQSQQ
jgi:hypothetical protein